MPAPRKNYAQAIELYNSGLSLADVASFFGITRQAIWSILKRRSVEMRPQLRFSADNHFYRHGRGYDTRVGAITKKAIQRGRLVSKPCEKCGTSGRRDDGRNKVEAHHDDYNKPLAVRWLCGDCHREWHKNNIPIQRTIDLPPMAQKDIARLGGMSSRRKK